MYYQIINSCDVSLWGVSQKDRIAKVLAKNRNHDSKKIMQSAC